MYKSNANASNTVLSSWNSIKLDLTSGPIFWGKIVLEHPFTHLSVDHAFDAWGTSATQASGNRIRYTGGSDFRPVPDRIQIGFDTFFQVIHLHVTG